MPDWKRVLSDTRFRVVALAVLIALGSALAWWGFQAAALPPPTPPPTAAEPGAGVPSGAATPETTIAAATPPPEPPRDTARITFTTNPPAHATVSWGKQRLGVITPKQALVVVRPRDSGPLDVIVRAPGYLQVTTRAHTFGDSRVVVKLTTPDQKSTLLGYRAPIDAGLPDGGGDMPPPGETIAPPPFP